MQQNSLISASGKQKAYDPRVHREFVNVIPGMILTHEDVQVAYAVRGNMQARGTKLTEQIVIGTPGTMLDWAIKFKFFDMKKIKVYGVVRSSMKRGRYVISLVSYYNFVFAKVFVLDEADVMIDTQGHQDQSIRLHRQLASKTCQQLLFRYFSG